ncbi:CRISPR-associated helicase Cas3' [Myxococcota bacterium]|nr:CRISPR-associated helicase Cas3' [Myxococcota bacterium]MBU1379573.1 CRISPR-associated helicase Cas3' [Myxococcota bacterium]MBU1495794.1 CRISPR-associated helicase Cas3' [Myxococcota bacterium]
MTQYQSFEDFFKKATGVDPYCWQKEIATLGDLPDILEIPTGLGKTAGSILAWIWRRINSQSKDSTPRRLVYCLPMRVLVEQTADNAVKFLKNLGLYDDSEIRQDKTGFAVYTLLGGDVDNDWDAYPEYNSIVIGTQDMLLSRALMRGYSMSPYRWPLHFSLLNNDCLWVFDEIQLMGTGLETSCQLGGFRENLKTAIPCKSIWMSATLDPKWLKTVDHKVFNLNKYTLPPSDLQALTPRLNAVKVRPDTGFLSGFKDFKETADKIVNSVHEPGSLTLVVLNTVKRAQELFAEINKLFKNKKDQSAPEILLLHSRFRPPEKKEILKKLLDRKNHSNLICIATQVIEAGLDISAKNMVTDISSWSSLVQRLGRLNRYGEHETAGIHFIDVPDNFDQATKLPPYDLNDYKYTIKTIENLTDFSIQNISTIGRSFEREPSKTIIRKTDFIELFDTTPDLSGMHIDISVYIRETDDRSVSVFFHHFENDEKTPDCGLPARDELVNILIADLDTRKRRVFSWNYLEGLWQPCYRPAPGMMLLLDADEGGYSTTAGYTGVKNDKDIPKIIPRSVAEHDSSDNYAQTGRFETISEHTEKVINELNNLLKNLKNLDLDEKELAALHEAAIYHDTGKAHEVFQKAVVNPPSFSHWAKMVAMKRYKRPGFRHELASAIAMLENGKSDLSVYLAAAHHGKVRMSFRSMPTEIPPDDGRLFARGVYDGDILPQVTLPNGVTLPPTKMNLEYMELGRGNSGESWLSRTLSLLEQYGPVKLSFMETILRISDWRASR